MKTIKIIDLLNKIANGEEVPKKIKYYGRVYDLKNDGCFDYYITDEWLLLDELESTSQLKDIVEILDEEKAEIEKLDMEFYHDEPALIEDMAHTINLIIDKLNKMEGSNE